MYPTTSSSPLESSSASTHYGEELQTVEALRAAITNNPSESLQALRANVDHIIATESRLEASQLEVQFLTTKISSLEAHHQPSYRFCTYPGSTSRFFAI